MVMPQLNKILENAVYLKTSSSSKIQESTENKGRRYQWRKLGCKTELRVELYRSKRKGGSSDQNKKKKPSKCDSEAFPIFVTVGTLVPKKSAN
jgi:hypothetical protein